MIKTMKWFIIFLASGLILWTAYLLYTLPLISQKKNQPPTFSSVQNPVVPFTRMENPPSSLSTEKIKCPSCSFMNESSDRYCLNCTAELWTLTEEESKNVNQKNRQLLHQRNQKVATLVEKEKAFIVRRNLFFSSKDIIDRLKKMEAYKDVKMEEMDSLLMDIAKCYQLTIHYKYGPSDPFLQSLKADKSAASPPEFKDVIHTLNMVDEFFSPYPVDLIRREIRDLYFVSSLGINEKPAAGLALVGRKKFLISCNCTINRLEILKTFHHEFAHLVVGQNMNEFPIKEWQKANPPDWKYRHDYWTSKRKINSDHPNANLLQEGFIREYGQESIEEDISTISEELFTNPEKIIQLSKQYPALHTKVLLLVKFFSKFGVEFNFDLS